MAAIGRQTGACGGATARVAETVALPGSIIADVIRQTGFVRDSRILDVVEGVVVPTATAIVTRYNTGIQQLFRQI
jgi:hypothetical protein